MSCTIEKKRWGPICPARIYINAGVARVIDLAMFKDRCDFMVFQIWATHYSLEQRLGNV